MDQLTKEQKLKLADERMAMMKIRNEETKKKHAAIEAEKRALGDAAAPPPTVTSSGWRDPVYKDDWERRDPENEGLRRGHGSAWPGESSEHDSKGSEDGHRGFRGDHRGHRVPPSGDDFSDPHSVSNTETYQRSPHQPHSSVRSQHHPSGRGQQHPSGRGRHSGSGRLSHTENSYDLRRKENAEEFEKQMQQSANGVHSSGGLLHDYSRDKPAQHGQINQDVRENHSGGRDSQTHRHPRNYGGTAGVPDLRDQIKQNRQRRSAGGIPINPELDMTGRERHAHSKWKEDRNRCDQERIERAKLSQGGWKREWDAEKSDVPLTNSEDHPAEYNIYRDIDNKKNTKRIGSGRVVIHSTSSSPAAYRRLRRTSSAGSAESPMVEKRSVYRSGRDKLLSYLTSGIHKRDVS